MENDEIKKLLEENLKLTKEIHTIANKTRRFIIWQQIYGLLKILIIAVPIVLGIIYLPPLLSDLYKQYSELLDASGLKGRFIPE